MTDRYWREIEDVENDIENAILISGILLKLKGYDDDIEKIDTNENNISSNKGLIDINTSNISDNSGLISTNEGNISSNSELISINEENISSNLSKLNNIENNLILVDDIYNETFPISRFSLTWKNYRIFYRQIYSNFTTNGIIKIDAKFNYVYDENYTLKHVYRFYNNRIQFKKIELDHDRSSNVINDKFEIQGIDSNRIDIELYYENNTDRKKIELVGINTIQINYIENNSKLDINKNNISSNTSSISDNKDLIESNTGLINTNTSSISNIILKSDKDFEKTYNIESQRFEFNKDDHFFNVLEKEIEHDFIKNSLLFVKNNMYYKYDDLEDDYHRCQHEYNIYDDNNNLIHKYLFNKDTYYNENSDILNTDEEFCIFLKQNYNKIKIVLELHRHNRHGFGNIDLEIDKNNNNYIKIEYIEKGILDNSHLVNLNTGSISTNSGLINTNTSSILTNSGLINTNTSDISDNKDLIDTNTSSISDNKNLIDTNTSTISDIEKGIELLIEPYNETFPISNRTITINRQILFEKTINFDFSGLGVFNILTTCNYDKYNFTHEYHFLNNNELIFKKSIDVVSNVVKDEFKFKSIDTSSLKIILYLTDANKKISLFGKNSLQFRYSKIKFKTDINENNIKTNLEKINKNSELIDTNKRDISFNLGLISNIKNNSTIIHDDIYNETFIFSNRTTTAQSQLIFKKIINFDFSNNGFFNILTVCNYDKKYNFNHKYRFFNNDELLKDVIIPMTSNVVKDEFKFEGIGDVSSLKIELYITDNFNNETIKLLSNSSLQFKYSKIEFKTDINENNIKSNLDKINEMSIKNNILYYTDLEKKELLRFDNDTTTIIRPLYAIIHYKEIGCNLRKDDIIEIECKLVLDHNIYDVVKNNLTLYYKLFKDSDILHKETRDYIEFKQDRNSKVTTFVKFCYKVKFDISKIELRIYIDVIEDTRKSYLVLNQCENSYISIKRF